MPQRALLASLVVLSALLGLGGCGKSAHSADERYYLVATNVKIPYWQAAGSGLADAAAKMRIRADLVGPETYDPKAQVEEFRRVMSLKPAGILVSPADPELLKGEINAAIAAGIPVITIDSDSPASQRVLFVGTNNYQAGIMGGRVLAQHLQGKGRVVVFTIPAQANLDERLRGYRDAIAQQPGIAIAQIADIRGDPAVAFDKTIDVTENAKPPVDAFVCLEATACKEVAEVLNRKKIRDKVVIAMDTDTGTLEWIEKGVIAATIGQRPYTMAYYGLKMLDDLRHNKLEPLNNQWAQNPSAPVPAAVDTGATLIDRGNIAAMRRVSGAPATSAGAQQ